MKKQIIHLVDDESIIHDIFRRILPESHYKLIISENINQALANHSPDVDVVIQDLMIPGASGIEIFKELKKIDPGVQVIFLTAYGTIESAIEAIKLGAADYLQKPFNHYDLKHRIERVIEEKRLRTENRQLKDTLGSQFAFASIIGKNDMLKKAVDIVRQVANANSTVLITGLSGTGKELIAKAIHVHSQRQDRPFLAFNSSNIPATLFESLLFGHKKGSFTGATADKKGAFEEADTGTIFLDEIATLPLELQAKILRVIQEKEIQPLGSNKLIKVDVRIIAATNVDLNEKVKNGQFRDDLFYRLNTIIIHLPTLKERKEDIPLLAQHFLQKYAAENQKSFTQIGKNYMQRLLEYDWPGNIRELENAILRSVLLSSGDTLAEETLPDEILRYQPAVNNDAASFYDQVEFFKQKIIRDALDKSNGVQKKAAKLLQLNTPTLTELIKRLGIQK